MSRSQNGKSPVNLKATSEQRLIFIDHELQSHKIMETVITETHDDYEWQKENGESTGPHLKVWRTNRSSLDIICVWIMNEIWIYY